MLVSDTTPSAYVTILASRFQNNSTIVFMWGCYFEKLVPTLLLEVWSDFFFNGKGDLHVITYQLKQSSVHNPGIQYKDMAFKMQVRFWKQFAGAFYNSIIKTWTNVWGLNYLSEFFFLNNMWLKHGKTTSLQTFSIAGRLIATKLLHQLKMKLYR